MKTIIQSLLCLKLAAVFLTATLFSSQASAATVPFKASMEGLETPSIPPSQPALLSASGEASHLGRFTFNLEADVSDDLSVATGSVQFTAANGDKIFGSFVGVATAINLPIISIEEVITVTGGTGRFAGIEGSITLTRIVDVTNGFTAGVFDGEFAK